MICFCLTYLTTRPFNHAYMMLLLWNARTPLGVLQTEPWHALVGSLVQHRKASRKRGRTRGDSQSAGHEQPRRGQLHKQYKDQATVEGLKKARSPATTDKADSNEITDISVRRTTFGGAVVCAS